MDRRKKEKSGKEKKKQSWEILVSDLVENIKESSLRDLHII